MQLTQTDYQYTKELLSELGWNFVLTNGIRYWYKYQGNIENRQGGYKVYNASLIHDPEQGIIKIEMVIEGDNEVMFEGVIVLVEELKLLMHWLRIKPATPGDAMPDNVVHLWHDPINMLVVFGKQYSTFTDHYLPVIENPNAAYPMLRTEGAAQTIITIPEPVLKEIVDDATEAAKERPVIQPTKMRQG